ncbi:hypothetical protein AAHE18_04G110100 [Arachis hypogaea]|nr:trithorax group protein osa [Arachis hypogaea]
MKKYADNLMRFLEGISSRLSQLELYCYNLNKSIGEMRSDLNRDHGGQDLKLKALEKHLQEAENQARFKLPFPFGAVHGSLYRSLTAPTSSIGPSKHRFIIK